METIWKRGNEFRFHRFPCIAQKSGKKDVKKFFVSFEWKRFGNGFHYL
jgi:hypothetical protein